MKYIDALKLINLCIENKLLNVVEGKVAIYRRKGKVKKEGWYLIEKEFLSQELMNDEYGIKYLTNKLKELGVNFIPDYNY